MSDAVTFSTHRSARSVGPSGDRYPARVSGRVFVGAKNYMQAAFRRGTLEIVARQLKPEHRTAVLTPNAATWYPEAALLALMTISFRELASCQVVRYRALVYEATLFAMRYDFREAMDLGGASPALAMLPRLWSCLQQGPQEVRVVPIANSTRVLVERCAVCSDWLYSQSITAMLQALLYAASGVEHGVSLVEQSSDRFTLDVSGVRPPGA